MNRTLLAVAVAVLLVASVAAPTGLALDAPAADTAPGDATIGGATASNAATGDTTLGGATADGAATPAFDLGPGASRHPALPGADGGGEDPVDVGVSRDDVDGSVAAEERGPPTVAGPLGSKLPGDGASARSSADRSTPSTADTASVTAAGESARFAPDETVEVVVVSEPGRSDAVADAVAARGGQVDGTYADRLAVELPAGAIAALAETEAVQHVREPAEPVRQGTISEGVDRMRADELHDLGGTGENATIAVLDVEFDPENEKIADQIVATKTMEHGGGFSPGTEGLHGTASAEAVADVAPDANLVLVSIGTDFDMIEAADYVETETDADAVTMSLGWYPSVGPLDGSDHLSQRIEESRQRGLVWVTSAGNQGEYRSTSGYIGRHYDKPWNSHENWTDYMDFDEVDGWDTALRVRNFGGGRVYVTWGEDTGSESPYNAIFYGVNSTGALVHLGNRSTDSPYEVYEATSSYDPIYVEIENVSGSRDHHIDVHTRGNLFLHPAYNVTQSALIPATSSDVITVAAVDQYDDRIAAYSSRGPTVDGRQGIDVAAPTNVSKLDDPGRRFTGTSAAAPHVGGLAGLLAGVHANASADALRLAIEHSGRAVSGDGAGRTDDTSTVSVGSGHVDALAALDALGANGTLTGSVSSAVTGDPLDDATVSVYGDGERIATATASNASYELALPMGGYDVTASAGDYRSNTSADVLVEGNATTTANVSLVPENGTIGGTVTDERGDPLEGATVGLESVVVEPVATDGNGTYVLDDVPAASERTLDVRARAYHANTSVTATLAPNGSAVRNATLERRAHYLGVDGLQAPADVGAGDGFEVGATIVNLGTDDWNDTVEYRVDGALRATEPVSLNATNATRIAFEDAIDEAGTHELSIATSDESPATDVAVTSPDDGGGLVIPTQEPSGTADVSVVSASVAAEGPVAVGDAVAVDVRLRNVGDADGSLDLELTADGDGVATTTATVPAGTSADATLSASFDEPGTYALAVDGTDAGTVEVRRPADAVPASENATASERPADAALADETPGFGVPVALLAILVGALAARRSS